MARINIEECWWTDPRREALGRLVGSLDLADAYAIRMWRLAQEFWKHDRGLVPKELFFILPKAEELVQCRLADVRGEFVYVRGSSVYLEWTYEKKQQAKAAGKKSAEARRAKTGSAQPKRRTSPERPPNEPRTEVNDAEPSGSGSVSGSTSDSKNKESIGTTAVAVVPPNQVSRGRKTDPPDDVELNQKTSRFIGAYVKAYQTKWPEGRPEDVKDGKTTGQIKSWLKSFPVDRACDLIQVYFQMDTKWFGTKGYDFQTFRSNLNKIGQALDSGADPDGNQINWNQIRKQVGA